MGLVSQKIPGNDTFFLVLSRCQRRSRSENQSNAIERNLKNSEK
jgi:hypothetical protein